jgi:predicted thioesterase
MKPTLQAGLTATSRIQVDSGRTISFLGEDSRVYATPFMLYDIEVVSRTLIQEHLEGDEDSVGSHAEISHLAPTPEGLWVDIQVAITEVKGRKVVLTFECRDKIEPIATGNHTRFVVDKNKTAEHIKSKFQRAAD